MESRDRLLALTRDAYRLRGLCLVPGGILLAALPALMQGSYRILSALNLTGSDHSPIGALFLVLGLLAILFGTAALERWISRYYDRLIGQVVLRDKHYVAAGMSAWLLGFFFCCVADGPHPPYSLTAVWTAALFLALFFSSGPWRWHYLAVVAAFLALSPSWNRMGSLDQGILLGSAFVLCGVIDHIVLTRVLLSQADGFAEEMAGGELPS